MKNEHIVAARRQRLRAWIEDNYPGDSHGRGKQAAFIADTGLDQTEISRLLKDKSFGEKKAESIEIAAKMPSGFLTYPLNEKAAISSSDDIQAIQMIVESLVKALAVNTPVAAQAFAEQLRGRAKSANFPVDRGLLATVLGIAEPDPRKAVRHVEKSSQLGFAAKAM